MLKEINIACGEELNFAENRRFCLRRTVLNFWLNSAQICHQGRTSAKPSWLSKAQLFQCPFFGSTDSGFWK